MLKDESGAQSEQPCLIISYTGAGQGAKCLSAEEIASLRDSADKHSPVEVSEDS